MKKRVVLFIKWRSNDGHFMISQYYVSEEFRNLILRCDFSYAVSILLFLAYDAPNFFISREIELGYSENFLKRLSVRLRSSFTSGWHIVAFSIYKKSLL